jgi:hypothetical protein
MEPRDSISLPLLPPPLTNGRPLLLSIRTPSLMAPSSLLILMEQLYTSIQLEQLRVISRSLSTSMAMFNAKTLPMAHSLFCSPETEL